MQNPFDSIDARLSNIEAILSKLEHIHLGAPDLPATESRYGNFNWYLSETGEAKSSARQRIARNEVPGITHLGKRLLFDKAVIRQWIKNNQRKTNAELATEAEESFNQRHTVRSDRRRAV